MKHSKVELLHPEKPLLLIVDPSLVFPQILKATLRRVDCEIVIVAFQQTELAIFWLSGEMDKEKAAKRPLATPWDEAPPLRLPSTAIVSLNFPIDERERVMDWLYVKSRSTKIITTSTSTEDDVHDQDDFRDELYWRHVVAHLPQPIMVEEIIERVFPILSS